MVIDVRPVAVTLGIGALGYLFVGSTQAPLAARALTRYALECVADTSGRVPTLPLPVISNTGAITFQGSLDGGEPAILALVNDTLSVVASGSEFPEFNPPSINKTGTIAFSVREAGSGPGLAVLTWRDGQLGRVVDRTDGPFTDLSTLPGITDGGIVSFWGRLADGSDVIGTRSIKGGPIRFVASARQGFAGLDQAPAINARRQVAFTGSPLPQGGHGVFVATARDIRNLVDSSGPFHGFSGAPSINSSGTVAFHANLDSGVSGIFTVSRTGEIDVVATEGDVLRNPQRPTINDRGEIAFMATIAERGVKGIFAGPNPATDKVAAVGDEVGGFTISALEFFRGLNDKGQVVFSAVSSDGRACVALASPHR